MDNELLDVLQQEASLFDNDPVADIEDILSRVFGNPAVGSFGQPIEEVATPAPAQTKRFNTEVTNDDTLDKDYERLIRMTQVFSKFASMLTLRNIRVGIEHDYHSAPDAPAWSDSDSITFNRSKIKGLDTPKAVTALKGLSLHEICHILLTPRDGTLLVKNVRAGKVWQAFNALEDMRIEMFMSSRFSNVAEWLSATVLQFLFDQPDQIKYQFPLTYGRKYLPVELREMARSQYVQPNDIAEFESLIDEYIVMNMSDPANYKRAYEIIEAYDKLIKNINEGQGYGEGWSTIKDANGHGVRKTAEWKPGNGKAMNKAQQQAIAVRIDTDNGEGYGTASDKAEPQDAGDGTPGSSVSAGAPGNGGLLDTIQDLLQDIYDSKQHEIEETIRQFNGEASLTAKEMAAPTRGDWTKMMPVDPKTVQVSRSFGAELEQLRGDHDPAWDRRVESGRLNVQRYVTGGEVDEAFDQWELGRADAVDIECVILLDNSGSMSWCMNNAYQSMWAIKRALDKINASTTVVTFADQANLLYSSTERAGISMKYDGTGGGTEPAKAVQYAHSVLANSNRAIKLCITITDGEWWNANATDNLLRQLRKSGVLTALAYVVDPERLSDGDTLKINSHGCEVATNITDSRDLFTLARKLVKVGVGRNLA
ncbi:vWFA domain containing protein [uncultured Caudovirales phage]|uniref:VWFA domain containing protein n=1 Tax=uncultured Caudovirales phage TaxID=2100421 RepID=A0A6J5KNB7_9CAUD|nr:vWFA domain containing protein [uncultured Caudovirales phage]